MEMTVDLKGVDKLIASSQAFRERLPGAVLNAMRDQLRRTLDTVKRDIASNSGIGQTIWGKNPKGLDKLVTLIQARVKDGAIETGIRVNGLPKIIDQGGTIKPHFIRHGFGRPKNRIPHPGTQVRQHGFARTALDRDVSKVILEVRMAVVKLSSQTFGQAA